MQITRCGRKQPQPASCRSLTLAYMLRIMRDPSQPLAGGGNVAKAAAPFCHSRLSSVEHSGEISRPTVIRAPAVSATLEEWGGGIRAGCKGEALMPGTADAATAYTIGWEPQPGPQTALLACPVFEVFFGGARGGGKTGRDARRMGLPCRSSRKERRRVDGSSRAGAAHRRLAGNLMGRSGRDTSALAPAP